MMLGQHHYEISRQEYSYMLKNKEIEYIVLAGAMYEGISTGLFDVVAHPDRAFKGNKVWTDEMSCISKKLIENAQKYHVKLEKNYSSMKQNGAYRPEFWEMVKDNSSIIYGCDAHNTKDIVLPRKIVKKRKLR